MKATEAAEILNGMRYKPGYRVYAQPVAGSLVEMELVLDTYDSSPDRSGRMHPAMITSPTVYIDAEKLDEEGVMGAGLLACLQVEVHEAREFWRDERTGRAPFHPHNKGGEAAMQRVANIPVSVRYPKPH